MKSDPKVFIVMEQMDGRDSILGVYSSEESAKSEVERLKKQRDDKLVRYKYPTDWFIEDWVVNDRV